MAGVKGERVSVSLPAHEKTRIEDFCDRLGYVPNEFYRRASLAYILCHEGEFNVRVDKAFQEVGPAKLPPKGKKGIS